MIFTCRRVADEEMMATARQVRRRVFIEEQGVPEGEEWDRFDVEATHFVLCDSPVGDEAGAVVGTARLVRKAEECWKVGRVAVLAEARGQGGGRMLMETAAAHARARGARSLVLDAQVAVIPFYERLGFAAEGEIFMDAGIPHRRMTKRLERP